MSADEHLLSLNQEKFCLAYIELGNARAAYAQVYPNSKPASQRRRAHEYMENPNIQRRIEEMRGELVERKMISIEDCVDELVADRKAARDEKNYNAAIKATENVARLLGYWVDNKNNSNDLSEADARKIVTQLGQKLLGPQ